MPTATKPPAPVTDAFDATVLQLLVASARKRRPEDFAKATAHMGEKHVAEALDRLLDAALNRKASRRTKIGKPVARCGTKLRTPLIAGRACGRSVGASASAATTLWRS
jgi:hypothetical protein